jgi:hypothetical protein
MPKVTKEILKNMLATQNANRPMGAPVPDPNQPAPQQSGVQGQQEQADPQKEELAKKLLLFVKKKPLGDGYKVIMDIFNNIGKIFPEGQAPTAEAGEHEVQSNMPSVGDEGSYQ